MGHLLIAAGGQVAGSGDPFQLRPAGLDLLFRIGDYSAAVHLAAGSCRGDDHAQRKGRKVHHTGSGPEAFPHVTGADVL